VTNGVAAEDIALAAFPRHTRPRQRILDFGMRHLFAFGVLAALGVNLSGGGCTPYIPVKDNFGTSALKPTGNIPPEFADFNNYDPGANALLAYQICATLYIPLAEKSLRASPGELIAADGRCRPYEITVQNLDEVFLP
jgi:hypothetical protein